MIFMVVLLKEVNSLWFVMSYGISESPLVKMMACCLFGAKSLPESMFNYRQLDN